MSRFELKIAAALVVAALLPLFAALWLASRLAEENLSLGLNPRVMQRLEATPGLFHDLFQARKQLYAEQARAVARALPRDRKDAPGVLQEAIRHTPRLRHVAWIDPSGAIVAQADNPDPNPEGEYRDAPARVQLPDGSRLECVFAIEAAYFAELDEARELAELYQHIDRIKGQIRASYVKSFALLLLGWAILTGAFGIALARRTTRRVSGLVKAVGELARGNLEVQVDPGSSGDEVAGLARAFNDMVREVREGRDRIVYLEKISGWQDVARRLAHEIKNPLTPIQLAFQQLEARYKGGDPAFERTLSEVGQIVREEIGTLQRLVEDFSAFAKLPEVRPEPADLAEFVDDFLKTSPQLAEGADLEVLNAAGAAPVALDKALMRRVLANLVKNAIEASRPERAKVHIGVARALDRAVLSVGDEGPGISPELRARIFDPYFTTKSDGTGLGLAIVKKIVLQHGGEIEVGEREGGGARFTVSLPVRLEPAATGAA